jgi:hypothetical protein
MKKEWRPPNYGTLPADFELMEDAQKLQIMLSMTLDQAAKVCLWDVNKIDGPRLGLWNMVRHDLWNLAFRIGLEDRRSAERERALNALVKDLPERFKREKGITVPDD